MHGFSKGSRVCAVWPHPPARIECPRSGRHLSGAWTRETAEAGEQADMQGDVEIKEARPPDLFLRSGVMISCIRAEFFPVTSLISLAHLT